MSAFPYSTRWKWKSAVGGGVIFLILDIKEKKKNMPLGVPSGSLFYLFLIQKIQGAESVTLWTHWEGVVGKPRISKVLTLTPRGFHCLLLNFLQTIDGSNSLQEISYTSGQINSQVILMSFSRDKMMQYNTENPIYFTQTKGNSSCQNRKGCPYPVGSTFH